MILKLFSNLFRSQGLSDLRPSRGSYDTVRILRGVAQLGWPSVGNKIIRMPLMVSFGLSFRAMLTEDIVEDKGAL